MKITRISYEKLDLQLSEPYTIAYETVSTAVNFTLKVETENGFVGYGCAAPDKVVTRESANDVESDIKNVIIPFLKGKNAFMSSQILVELKPLLTQKSSALAMVDIALLDLAARKFDIPLYQYLGGFRHHIITSITIGIITLEDTLKTAKEFVAQGFQSIKLKGGLSVAEDVEKMIRLREQFPTIELRFDGNQGYTPEQALSFYEQTKHISIEFFEQPIAVGLDSHLGKVTDKTTIPVMADESIKSVKDTFRLAKGAYIDMINIKIMKVGGIKEAMHINSVAKSAGLEAMVGCIDECSLGIAAGLHFALSQENVLYADLDGHLDIINDPFKSLFTLKKGILYPSNSPGLGKIE
ncbi:mandelate racemase/muconate lactonizing enzyme family protein [Kordia zhangzhouensis]|uniref:mandelate racemase/muconate lactonizing enzyme family protein n=1 Tax=Kordia zhangzhouensis TaxID=1620405 RepID=UPI000629644A|nr:dipeptide epimerase [Kordia zhangzhouensis]